MSVPTGCTGWSQPPSNDVELLFGDAPASSHDGVDLQWCADVADPDPPLATSTVYANGNASAEQIAALEEVVRDGGAAIEQAVTTVQPSPNPNERTLVADPEAVAKDWAEETRRRVRLPPDPPPPFPEDPLERRVTPQIVQRLQELDLRRLAELSAQVQILESRLLLVRRNVINLYSRLRMLEGIGDNPIQGAWCADYTEDLSGEVATAELPDEGLGRLNIRPGYADAAAYAKVRDGQLHLREGQVGYQAYFNAAILPGVQKWRPQYRIGTLTAVNNDTDTCSLTLQSETSSANSLLVDPPTGGLSLSGVPIEYMDCDSVPFEVGDRVLVELQNRDWEQPRVIGFEKEPKSCLPRYIAIPISPWTVRSYSPMPTYNDTAHTDLIACPDLDRNVFCYYRGGELLRTRNTGAGSPEILDFISYTVPEGYSPADKGLWVYWNDFLMLWGNAVGYNNTVGGVVFSNKPPAPQEFDVDEYVAAEASVSTFVGVQPAIPVFEYIAAGVSLVSVNTKSFHIPEPVGGGDDPRFVDLGYDALYRFDAHAYVEERTVGESTPRVSIGDYTFEKLTDDPAEIASSYLSVPPILTVPISEGSTATVTYSRVTVGWRPRPGNPDFRVLTAIYVLDGEAAPEFAAGYWAV